jgi:hypothetical protein
VTKSMKTPVVSYDEMTFILGPEDLRQDSILPILMGNIGIEDVKKIKAIVDAIVAQVLSNMTPRDRKEFESVMFEQIINVEYHDGVPVILG